MSILNAPIDNVTPAQRKATRLKMGAKQMTETMAHQWAGMFSALWDDQNPQDILDELGTDAAEFFELNTALVTFMLTSLTGKRDDLVAMIQEKVATLPAHTVNPDGTVTVD